MGSASPRWSRCGYLPLVHGYRGGGRWSGRVARLAYGEGLPGVVAHVGGRGLVDQVAQTVHAPPNLLGRPESSPPRRSLIAVFGAFVLSGEVNLKVIGVGLAASVLIDETVVAWSWYRR